MNNYYNKQGRYNLQTRELNKEAWFNVPANVYVIECWSRDHTEHFYKVGLTCTSVPMRFANGMPYKWKLLQLTKTSLYWGIEIEQELLQKLKGYSYVPKIRFSGHTEAVSDIATLYN